MRGAVWVETLSSGLSLNKLIKKQGIVSVLKGFFCFFILLCCSDAYSESIADSQQHIRHIEVSGLYSISKEELLYLLDLQKDKALDRAALSRGIKRAFLKGVFDDIRVEIIDREGIDIKVTVVEKPIIRSINIKGNSYLPDKFIKRHLTISKGDRLNLLKIGQSLISIENALKEKGFLAPSVSYDLIHKDNAVDVIFEVIEGKPDIIKQIIIHGHEDVVLSFLRLSVGDIFDRTEMERLSSKLKEYYKKQGYILTSLEYYYNEGVLAIKFNKGKKINIDFEGNSALSSKRLMKEVPFFKIGDYSDELLEETTARIITLYHQQGYPFTQIAPAVSVSEEDISIKFFIFEGERYIVDSVNFENMFQNAISIPEERLRNILALKAGGEYNPDFLESDRTNIEEFYRALGYLYVKVMEPEVETSDNRVKIRFKINEGDKVMLSNIAVKGNMNISDKEIFSEIPLTKGNPYNEIDISDARQKIIQLYNDRGFLDARVLLTKNISGTSADVTFEIIEGDITLFGKAIVRGNDKTKYRLIKRKFLLEENRPLNYSLLFKERHRLYRLGLFADVDVELLERLNGKRDILYILEEANAGAVEFGLGYGEYERLKGFFDISYRNLWGMNRYGSLRIELSTLEQRLMLSYHEPLFIGREDLILKGLILYEDRKEKDIDTGEIRYRIKRKGASLGIEKRFSKELQAELYYDFSLVKTLDVKPGVILSREDVGTFIISGLRHGLLYDTRDNPFNPQSGLLAGASLKLASSIFLSDTEFAKIILYANQYHSLSKRIVLAVSLRGGAAKGLGATKELPIIERFFLGGRTTVRGYEQDTLGPKGKDGTPTGGNAFLMGNLELRLDAGKGIGIVTFLDGGNVWEKLQDVDIGGIKFTTGIGLRYNTPIGPFRIDYGYKLSRELGEGKSALHFSIGHAF